MLVLVSLQARISESTPRDLRGVKTLTALAAETFGSEPILVPGRTGPFKRTAWQDDLAASRSVLTQVGRHLADTLAGDSTLPLTLATDCALAIGTLPVVARLRPETRVLWLDAHCDFDTPETTTLGFLGCMSLAGACGRWDTGFGPAFPEGQVVLCGTRPAPDDFDIVSQRAVEASAVRLIGISDSVAEEIAHALDGAPVYLHLDPDVLDPSVFPIPYARPNGLSAASLCRILEHVAERNPVIGVEITAFHSPDEEGERAALAELLLDAVAPLLAPPLGTMA